MIILGKWSGSNSQSRAPMLLKVVGCRTWIRTFAQNLTKVFDISSFHIDRAFIAVGASNILLTYMKLILIQDGSSKEIVPEAKKYDWVQKKQQLCLLIF
jgi:hypothetical protein